MPEEHSHVMGGSTAQQRIQCPLSLSMHKNLPEAKESEFAKRGTILHTAMELMLTQNPQSDDEVNAWLDELIGTDLSKEQDGAMLITQDDTDFKLWPAWDAWCRVHEKYNLVDYFIEQRVSLNNVIEGAFGTADILAIDDKKRLHVLDWKFGDGVPVSVEENLGLGFYAGAALYDEDPELINFCGQIPEENGEVVLHIVQPRTGYDEDPLQTWETTVSWVENVIDLSVEAINKALSENPPSKAGPWCRWCQGAVLMKCETYTSTANNIIAVEGKHLPATEIAEWLSKAEFIKKAVDHIYALAQQEMERGVQVPGWKLVRKKTNRLYKDGAEEKIRAIFKRRKMRRDTYVKETLLTPAQLEKNHRTLYEKELSSFVKKPEGALTVAKDDDKRSAVANSMNLLGDAMKSAGALPRETKQETEK